MKADPYHEHHDWTPADEAGDGRDRGPGLSRFLSGGEDPTMWSVPLYRLGNLHVRAHWVWIVGLVLGLVLSVPLNKVGPLHVLTAMGWGILLIVIREHVRCQISGAGRRAPHVAVLWDFGCMNLPEIDDGPTRPRLHAVGGILCNLALVPVTTMLIWWMGAGRSAILFDPMHLSTVVGGLGTPRLAAAWWLHATNLMILAANLLPMLPMDAGRALVAWRERAVGREAAVLRAARVGIYIAGATLVAAVAAGSEKLAAIALVGGFVCWMQTSRAKLLGIGGPGMSRPRDWSLADAVADMTQKPISPPKPSSPLPEETDSQEVDRILAKISEAGMDSLSAKERRTLQRATQRRRDAGG